MPSSSRIQIRSVLRRKHGKLSQRKNLRYLHSVYESNLSQAEWWCSGAAGIAPKPFLFLFFDVFCDFCAFLIVFSRVGCPWSLPPPMDLALAFQVAKGERGGHSTGLHRRCRAPVPASRTASERETASGGLPITILVTHILDISDDSNFEKEALQYVWVMPWLKNASLNAALQNGAIWFYRLPCSPNIFIHWHCQTAILKQKQHVQAQTCCQESVGLRPKQVRKVLLPHHIQCQQYAYHMPNLSKTTMRRSKIPSDCVDSKTVIDCASPALLQLRLDLMVCPSWSGIPQSSPACHSCCAISEILVQGGGVWACYGRFPVDEGPSKKSKPWHSSQRFWIWNSLILSCFDDWFRFSPLSHVHRWCCLPVPTHPPKHQTRRQAAGPFGVTAASWLQFRTAAGQCFQV